MNKTTNVVVRCSKNTKERIKKVARYNNKTVSSYISILIEKDLGKCEDSVIDKLEYAIMALERLDKFKGVAPEANNFINGVVKQLKE